MPDQIVDHGNDMTFATIRENKNEGNEDSKAQSQLSGGKHERSPGHGEKRELITIEQTYSAEKPKSSASRPKSESDRRDLGQTGNVDGTALALADDDKVSVTLSELLKSSINSDDLLVDLVEEKRARINHKEVGPLQFDGPWQDYTRSIKDKVDEGRLRLAQEGYKAVRQPFSEIKYIRENRNQQMTNMINNYAKNSSKSGTKKEDYPQFSGDELKDYFFEGVPGGFSQLKEKQAEIDTFVRQMFSYWSKNKKFIQYNNFLKNMVIFGIVPDLQFMRSVIDSLRVKISG